MFGFDTKDVIMAAVLGASMAEEDRREANRPKRFYDPRQGQLQFREPPEPASLRETVLCLLTLAAVLCGFVLVTDWLNVDVFWWVVR